MKSTMFLATLLLFSEAFANNLFIPNYYRNRRTENEFSALGWSTRKEASIEYGQSTIENKFNGADAGDTDTTDLTGNVFYRVNENVNLEVVVDKAEEKPEGGSTDTTNGWDLGVGYQFGEMPIALGFSYENEDAEDDDTKTYNLGAGYRLNDNIYLGIGYANAKTDITGGDETSTRTVIGGGYVWGDVKKADAAAEAAYVMYGEDSEGSAVIVKGLWNYGPAQYYAEINSVDGKFNEVDITGSSFTVGVDYEFSSFYLAPEIFLNNLKADGSPDTKSTDTNWSLEVGHRAEGQYEVFGRYVAGNGKVEADPDENKTTTSGWVLGATYFF